MVVSGSFPDGVPAFGSGTMVSVIPSYSILLDIIDVSIRIPILQLLSRGGAAW